MKNLKTILLSITILSFISSSSFGTQFNQNLLQHNIIKSCSEQFDELLSYRLKKEIEPKVEVNVLENTRKSLIKCSIFLNKGNIKILKKMIKSLEKKTKENRKKLNLKFKVHGSTITLQDIKTKLVQSRNELIPIIIKMESYLNIKIKTHKEKEAEILINQLLNMSIIPDRTIVWLIKDIDKYREKIYKYHEDRYGKIFSEEYDNLYLKFNEKEKQYKIQKDIFEAAYKETITEGRTTRSIADINEEYQELKKVKAQLYKTLYTLNKLISNLKQILIATYNTISISNKTISKEAEKLSEFIKNMLQNMGITNLPRKPKTTYQDIKTTMNMR